MPDIPLSAKPMAQSAFIVRVPEAEGCVSALRGRFDASARLGVPAHITVLFPFMSPEKITFTILKQAQSALSEMASFSFTLAKVARFPATAYLAPEPAEHFVTLTEALVRAFPSFLPFGGEHASVAPHLTVANGSVTEAELAAAELEVLLQAHGPIRGVCSSVALLENSSGFWKEMRVFTLSRQDGYEQATRG